MVSSLSNREQETSFDAKHRSRYSKPSDSGTGFGKGGQHPRWRGERMEEGEECHGYKGREGEVPGAGRSEDSGSWLELAAGDKGRQGCQESRTPRHWLWGIPQVGRIAANVFPFTYNIQQVLYRVCLSRHFYYGQATHHHHQHHHPPWSDLSVELELFILCPQPLIPLLSSL